MSLLPQHNQIEDTMLPPHYYQQCHHKHNLSLYPATLLYCLALSVVFVLSLYIFIPHSIRKLPRDNVTHIQWRSLITIIVAILTVMIVYPWLFCQTQPPQQTLAVSAQPWYIYLGFVIAPMQDTIQIAIHVLTLYLGSITCSFLRIYHHARELQWMEDNHKHNYDDNKYQQQQQQQQQLPFLPKLKHIFQSIYISLWRKNVNLEHNFHSSSSLYTTLDRTNIVRQRRWITIRNLIIAPIVEEIIFRACLLPPLLASRYGSSSSSDDGSIQRLTPTKACWIAPLFFGVAHLHHFYEKYRQQQTTAISYDRHEERRHDLILHQLIIELTIQWTYTTLFGAYVSHVFIRTGSIMCVIVAHIICNYMGLPDIEFIFSTKSYYLSSYTSFISFMYLVGIVLFIYGFKSTIIFPTVSVLPSLLQLQ